MANKTLYRPEYCEKLIAHMGEGYSYESFAGEVDVHIDTLYEWDSTFKKFSEAKKKGYAKMLALYEKIGMGGMIGKIPRFHDAVWIFQMKNRFRWTDKIELATANDSPIKLAYDPTVKLSKSK